MFLFEPRNESKNSKLVGVLNVTAIGALHKLGRIDVLNHPCLYVHKRVSLVIRICPQE
jgi:hypothetical protein